MEGVSSFKIHMDSGVSKSIVLGPLMVLLFINDLPSQVSSQVGLFADNCLLCQTIESEKDYHQLRAYLYSIGGMGK